VRETVSEKARQGLHVVESLFPARPARFGVDLWVPMLVAFSVVGHYSFYFASSSPVKRHRCPLLITVCMVLWLRPSVIGT